MVKKLASSGDSVEAAWRASHDADTLASAGEIMADNMRHQAAMSHVKKKMAGMQRIVGQAPARPAKKQAAPKRAPSLGFAKKGK